jgi:hypothetical protein
MLALLPFSISRLLCSSYKRERRRRALGLLGALEYLVRALERKNKGLRVYRRRILWLLRALRVDMAEYGVGGSCGERSKI